MKIIPAFHARIAGLQAAAGSQCRHRTVYARKNVPAEGRDHDFLHDGPDLVPGVVSTAPEGAEGPAINYSLAAMLGDALQPVLAPLGFNWQISVALIPGMALAKSPLPLGTVYAIEGGKEAAEQIGLALASKWSLATAVAARMVHLCPTVRFDARRDSPRDRELAVDGDHLHLHAGAGLSRLSPPTMSPLRSARVTPSIWSSRMQLKDCFDPLASDDVEKHERRSGRAFCSAFQLRYVAYGYV
jgi:hypothetical protein